MLWIWLSLFAATVQSIRFMVQKKLHSDHLSSVGATFTRYLYSLPLIVAAAGGYIVWGGGTLPDVKALFWLYALAGGITQIMATILLIILFQKRNFTVGLTLIKAQIMLTALFGYAILGDKISFIGALAIALGVLGVIFLIDAPPEDKRPIWQRILSLSTAFGLGSSVFFALCAVMFRAATQHIVSEDAFTRSLATLLAVVTMQTVMLIAYLYLFEKGQIREVLRMWPVASWVGVLSFFGSVGWFTAFALQNAAYVSAVGQVDVVFGLLASFFIYNERFSKREALGIIFLIISILLIIVYV